MTKKMANGLKNTKHKNPRLRGCGKTGEKSCLQHQFNRKSRHDNKASLRHAIQNGSEYIEVIHSTGHWG